MQAIVETLFDTVFQYAREDVELLQGKVCRTSFYTTNVLGRYIKLVAQFFLCPSLCCTHCANLCSNRFV